tara:strand:- start:246 stop:410 length:165 start_codon:yes stop_codon:yes gene_type:complete
MKKLIILIVSVIIFTACTKQDPSQNIISEAEPIGYIDSLSHKQCHDLPKPEKKD